MKRVNIGILLTIASLSACDDERVDLGEHYELVAVDGQPLPYTLPVEDHGAIRILGETMEIEREAVSLTIRVRFVTESDSAVSTGMLRASYDRIGDLLVLHPGEPSVPDSCEGAPVYRIEADGELLRWVGNQANDYCAEDVEFQFAEFLYERID